MWATLLRTPLTLGGACAAHRAPGAGGPDASPDGAGSATDAPNPAEVHNDAPASATQDGSDD